MHFSMSWIFFWRITSLMEKWEFLKIKSKHVSFQSKTIIRTDFWNWNTILEPILSIIPKCPKTVHFPGALSIKGRWMGYKLPKPWLKSKEKCHVLGDWGSEWGTQILRAPLRAPLLIWILPKTSHIYKSILIRRK